MRSVVAALVVGIGACGPQLLETPAEVLTVYGKVQQCTVKLNWPESVLFESCGEPVQTVPWATNASGRCHLYATFRHAFVGERGAPWLAVCVAEGDAVRSARTRAKSEPEAARPFVVHAVYGVAADGIEGQRAR